MSMDREQKHDLRIKVCRLMDAGKTEEARKLMDILCGVDATCPRPDDKRQRCVRVTDINGNMVEYRSVAICAEAMKASVALINKAIRIGTPVTGKLKGYVFDADEPSHGKRSTKAKAIKPNGEELMFDSISIMVREIGACGGTVYKFLNLGTPVIDGKFEGWRFERCKN